MKVYSTAPDGNEAADLEPAHYFNLAEKRLQKSYEHIIQTDKPVQVLLVNLDILLHLSKKYPALANLTIQREEAAKWKQGFYDWYARCSAKIPAKFREGIKESADALFAELEQLGY